MSGDRPATGDPAANGEHLRAPPAAPGGLADALGHLQQAALSMVAAGRSALDVAERLARDPAPLLDLVTEAARAARPGPPDRDAAADDDDPASTGAASRPGPRVQRIVVAPPDTSVAEPDDEAGDGQAPR